MKRFLFPVAACLAASLTAHAQNYWTGTGTSLNWSDSANWTSGTPAPSQLLYFEDLNFAGYTNSAGAVNNVANGNFALGALYYAAYAKAPSSATAPAPYYHFHTTFIPAANTLTLGGLGNSVTTLAVGDIPSLGLGSYAGPLSFPYAGYTNYSTLTGGGSLNVNEPAGLISIAGALRSALDLSGLSNFTANVSQLWVGASRDNNFNLGSAVHSLVLARTNLITTAANLSAPGILMGAFTNTGAAGVLLLGQTNQFDTDGLVVGGRRAGGGTTLAFSSSYSNSFPLAAFSLRGSAGNNAASVFSVGDLSADTDGYNAFPFSSTSSSVADFSGGNVDIWVDSLFIGRSTPRTNVNSSATGQGTLIVENGTITATNVFIAYKPTATNNTAGQGSLLLRSNGVMNVVKDLYLCFRTNGSAFINTANLAVRDNAVLNIGGSILCTNVGSWTPATMTNNGTINLANGGTVFTPVLAGVGSINGASLVTVTNALAPGTPTGPGTLLLASNLALRATMPLNFRLGANTTVGGGVNDLVGVANNVAFNNNPLSVTFAAPLIAGTYLLVTNGGTQSGTVTWVNPTRSTASLVQTATSVGINVSSANPATLVWAGTNGVTGVWDSNVANWNTNLDKFFTLDNVVFDDSAAATNVSMSVANLPASVTFNSTNKYFTVTQSGSGAIAGFTALNKNGPNQLLMGGGGVSHTFTGPVNINGGSIKVASFNTGVFGTTASVNPINIASGAMLDLNGNSIGSPSSYARFVNVAGAGVGGIGAIVHNGPSSGPSLTTRDVNLTADTTFGCTGAGLVWTLAGLTPPFPFALNLNGYTLSTVGAGSVRLNQLTITNNGSINVGGSYLGINSSIIDGGGAINLGNNYLNFYAGFTAGYVAKAITCNNGAVSAGTANATPIPLKSAISIADGGSIGFTNSQIILASGVISGNGTLNKSGPSNLVLSAANLYTGSTIVGAGVLALTNGGSLASPLVAVNNGAGFDVTGITGGYTVPAGQTVQMDGAGLGDFTASVGGTLRGSGSISGLVTVASGGTLAIGSPGQGGTLTVSTNLTFNGGTNALKLGGPDDLVVVGGNLTFTAPTVIRIDPVGGLTGTHILYQYGGTLLGVDTNHLIFSTPRPLVFVLNTNTPGVVSVTISGSVSLDWAGGAPSAPTAWDAGTTTNWLNGANPDVFFPGDAVTFGDGANTNLVSLATTMQAASVTMNNSTPYAFIGAGGFTAGNLAMNGSSLTLSNAGNVTLTGSGLGLNAGTLTFSPASNATLAAKITGGGGLAKAGTNSLTVVSPDSTNFSGTVAVNGGTLRSGSVNALGASAVTINPGATWDLNGQVSTLSSVSVSGAGADSQGAINNRGAVQTNAINNVTLLGDTTLGAANRRWDVSPVDPSGIPGSFVGNNYKLTKTGTNDLWLRQNSDTGLGDIDIAAGRLIFAGSTTLLGNTSSNIVVRTNATLGFGGSVKDPGKNTLIAPGGTLYASGSGNRFGGSMILSNGLLNLEPNAQLTLSGNLSGPATLTVQGVALGNFGTLTLSGTNTYTGGTLINDGELDFASSNSIPANTNIVMSSRVLYNSSGHPVVGLLTNVVSPASVRLDMQTVGSAGAAQAFLTGNAGTWAGPIRISGNIAQCTANFSAGLGGLTIAGAVDGSGFTGNINGNGGVKIAGDSVLVNDVTLGGTGVRFNGSLQFTGSLSCVNSGLGGSPGMTKLVLASAGNYWTDMYWNRGIIQIGADNALPFTPITIGTLVSGADHRVILDLNGHTQTIAAWLETFTGNDPTWFGNSATNGNATLIYAGTGTNSWSAYIVDAFDITAAIQKQTALSVTAGYLKLVPFPFGDPPTNSGSYFPSGPPPYPFGMTYTGPTLVSGGTLEVDKYLGVSPVTVANTGTLRGVGPIGGQVLIAPGGTLAPGTNVIRTLVVTNNLTFQAGGKGLFRVNLTTGVNDQVVGINTLTYGGTLVITNIGAQPFTNGTAIKLFDAATYVAGAVAVQPTVPGPGLVWNTSQLAVNGNLLVTTATAPGMSSPSRALDGTISFTITGTPGQGYSVRAATNISLPIASWTVLQSGTLPGASYLYTDSSATNFPARYYRISTP